MPAESGPGLKSRLAVPEATVTATEGTTTEAAVATAEGAVTATERATPKGAVTATERAATERAAGAGPAAKGTTPEGPATERAKETAATRHSGHSCSGNRRPGYGHEDRRRYHRHNRGHWS